MELLKYEEKERQTAKKREIAKKRDLLFLYNI